MMAPSSSRSAAAVHSRPQLGHRHVDVPPTACPSLLSFVAMSRYVVVRTEGVLFSSFGELAHRDGWSFHVGTRRELEDKGLLKPPPAVVPMVGRGGARLTRVHGW